jgi:uncharacterized damage-inducible protein DinB
VAVDRCAQFASMAEYNRWANNRILAVSSELTDEQFDLPAGASYGSLHGTLDHILSAELSWLRRWRGEPSGLSGQQFGRHQLSSALAQADQAFVDFVSEKSDDDWDGMIEYRNTKGSGFRRSLGVTLTQVLYHGTYHRGEAAMMLSVMGNSPGDLDYIYFVRDGV